jgi:2-succinyl-6-hydroxy-2,4-cyclohexadiene-1-carboxylate synthase
MEPLYYRLKEIPCKTLLITGELDSKFTTLSKEMTLPLPTTEHLIIPDAGHNIHLEKPAHYITAINKFLSVI